MGGGGGGGGGGEERGEKGRFDGFPELEGGVG